jgi:hypothetical protein
MKRNAADGLFTKPSRLMLEKAWGYVKMKKIVGAVGIAFLPLLLWSISWGQVNRILLPPEGGTIQALAVDPFNPSVIYAGTAVGGVFKSTDTGETWLPSNNGLGSLMVASLAEGIFEIRLDTTVLPPMEGIGGGGCFVAALFPCSWK